MPPSLSPDDVVQQIGKKAKSAANALLTIPEDQINACLHTLAQSLIDQTDTIQQKNKLDIQAAKEKSRDASFIDRLTLTPDRIDAIAQSVKDIAALPDPTNNVLSQTIRPNGLLIKKTSTPIGVLGMIYESRPNVTIDAAALCLKSHNAVILRGGSDSIHTAIYLHTLIQSALSAQDIPINSVHVIKETDRAYVSAMLRAANVIDVMIPRGGKSLTSRVMEEAKMPVFAHLDGNCHIYVHHDLDLDRALPVIQNAKLRRTGICGAAESLLIDRRLDTQKAVKIITHLLDQGCTIYGDAETQALHDAVVPASHDDWSTEYLAAKISCKFVADENEAITHINEYGSHHTDCILTQDTQAAEIFQQRVDSAIVMHNTSTQFADGGEFGMGAEIGIGTGKLHARGPVGLEQLTTFKYIVSGNGQTRP